MNGLLVVLSVLAPLAAVFGGTITSTNGSGDQTFHAQPVPTTEGK
jgi:hypothetical protein